jgi:hypothetical protein
MQNQESSVRKAVKETVIKTVEKIDSLKEKSKPFADEIRQDLSEAGRQAVKLSGQAVDAAVVTARDAVQGFREGIDEVRKKGKTGKNS